MSTVDVLRMLRSLQDKQMNAVLDVDALIMMMLDTPLTERVNMELGAYANDFNTANTYLGNGLLRGRRVFEDYLDDMTWQDTPAGVRPFWSCKAPKLGNTTARDWAGARAGMYDDRYAAMFAAFPANGRLTVAHEPEDDMTSAQFRELTERLVPIFRANAPAGAQYWIVGNHWQYDPAHTTGNFYQGDAECADYRALVDGTGVVTVDGAALDVYIRNGEPMEPFNVDGGWVRWQEKIGQYAQQTGLAERGIVAQTAATRVSVLRQDVKAATELGLSFYYYWQSGGPAGENTIAENAGRDTFRAMAAALWYQGA